MQIGVVILFVLCQQEIEVVAHGAQRKLLSCGSCYVLFHEIPLTGIANCVGSVGSRSSGKENRSRELLLDFAGFTDLHLVFTSCGAMLLCTGLSQVWRRVRVVCSSGY